MSADVPDWCLRLNGLTGKPNFFARYHTGVHGMTYPGAIANAFRYSRFNGEDRSILSKLIIARNAPVGHGSIQMKRFSPIHQRAATVQRFEIDEAPL